jgi:hypothetical protein
MENWLWLKLMLALIVGLVVAGIFIWLLIAWLEGGRIMVKKSRRPNRRTRKSRQPNVDIVNNSPSYSPERFVMNVYTMRLESIAIVSKRMSLVGGIVTDKLGPKGAAQYIRDAILSGNIPDTWHAPESPDDIAWLESANWWELTLDAAKRIGIVIP